jgi:glycosyltransferase involved in cell wall biosynthesis
VQRHADVVHLHGIDFAGYMPPPGPPVLVTLHLPPDWYPPEALHPTRPDTWLNCVSAAQHRACPAGAHLLPPILNGVPVEALAARHARRGYALALGRICPEKGQHLAVQAAHLADVSLILAGIAFPYPEHRAYFNEQVAPLLDRRRRCIGQIDFARKRRLLSAARCLLVPSLAAETSSLVAMEALACGTPVIAFRAGALPEIVRDQETGFVVEDVASMAQAIGRAGGIDPQTCRADARNRFLLRRTTEAYLAVYERLARRAA